MADSARRQRAQVAAAHKPTSPQPKQARAARRCDVSTSSAYHEGPRLGDRRRHALLVDIRYPLARRSSKAARACWAAQSARLVLDHTARVAPRVQSTECQILARRRPRAPGPPNFLWPRRPWRCLARRRPAACAHNRNPSSAAASSWAVAAEARRVTPMPSPKVGGLVDGLGYDLPSVSWSSGSNLARRRRRRWEYARLVPRASALSQAGDRSGVNALAAGGFGEKVLARGGPTRVRRDVRWASGCCIDDDAIVTGAREKR